MQQARERKEELELINDSIADALEAAVEAEQASDDLAEIAKGVQWVLGQDEVEESSAKEPSRQRNATRVSS